MWFLTLTVVYLAHCGSASPIAGYKPLTPEELERSNNWKETDKQNIWELSGQFEGDIILNSRQRNGIPDSSRLWYNNEIPYMFHPGLTESEKLNIQYVLQDMARYSCVKPKLITRPVRDYVLVQGTNEGCYSYIGRIGDAQVLNLESGTSCHSRETIMHEFLHALGFHHQQNAMERDHYVIIHKQNIEEGKKYNFHKQPRTNNFNTAYDYSSIMHYSGWAFSKNGRITVETKDQRFQNVIGQATELSQTDIIKLTRMYSCPGY